MKIIIAVTIRMTAQNTMAGYAMAERTFWRSSTCFSSVVESLRSTAVELTADLAGPDHRDVEGREHLRELLERGRERRPLLDVQADLEHRLAKRLGLDLVGEHAERPHEREAGGDHRRQLAAHERDVLQGDPVGDAGDGDLALQVDR